MTPISSTITASMPHAQTGTRCGRGTTGSPSVSNCVGAPGAGRAAAEAEADALAAPPASPFGPPPEYPPDHAAPAYDGAPFPAVALTRGMAAASSTSRCGTLSANAAELSNPSAFAYASASHGAAIGH